MPIRDILLTSEIPKMVVEYNNQSGITKMILGNSQATSFNMGAGIRKAVC